MDDEFSSLYAGRLWSVLSWDQLSEFWQRIDPGAGWYLFAPGVDSRVPDAPAQADVVEEFITRIDALLRDEHRETYCGIVYANDLQNPHLIKIFDPNNLGSSCGSSKNPPGPGWIMSRVRPGSLETARPAPAGRQRWWKGLFGDS